MGTDLPPPYPGINGNNGYSPAPPAQNGAAGGWTQPQPGQGASVNGNLSSAERKAAEAAASAGPGAEVQTGYYDPNNPGYAYVPPPAYYNEPPPSYGESNK